MKTRSPNAQEEKLKLKAAEQLEADRIKLLMEQPGKVFSTIKIYETVWQEPAFGNEGAVAVHIRHLREKIEINPSEPRYIKVVWGQGYKIEGGKP